MKQQQKQKTLANELMRERENISTSKHRKNNTVTQYRLIFWLENFFYDELLINSGQVAVIIMFIFLFDYYQICKIKLCNQIKWAKKK